MNSSDAEKFKAEDICHSPSWSDLGEKQRNKGQKRAEKEQKEREKRHKQDEERQDASEVKAGKRLSKKPPPAAMETQKMPPALRRNSWISLITSHTNPGEDTRRSSRDEKRLSGLSFGSTKSSQRSQSTPATSAEEVSNVAEESEQRHSIVSPSAPKLPSFGWSSRRSSSTNRKSPSSGSEAAYDGNMITFAYRLDATTIVDEAEKRDRSQVRQSPKKSPKKATQQQQSDIAVLSRSSTEPTLTIGTGQGASRRSPRRSSATKRDNPKSENVEKDEGADIAPLIPTPGVEDTAARMVAEIAEQDYASYHSPPSTQSATLPHAIPSHDGGSYVHKQRMYQQQQSIAGFQDQQAIQDANDLAAEYEALLSLPQTPQSARGRAPASSKIKLTSAEQLPDPKIPQNEPAIVSPARSQQRQRSISPQVESAPTKQHSHKPSSLFQGIIHKDDGADDTEHARVRKSVQSARDSISSSRSHTPSGSKSSRILGFRRRTKELPALVAVPYSSEEQILVVQSAPLDTTPHEEPAAKRSRIERLFREPKPAFANEGRRKRSGSLARSPTKEDSPTIKQTQSHSMTQIASSAAPNDILHSPKILPRSSTEPAVISTSKLTKSALKVKDGPQSPNFKQDAAQSKPERPPRKQSTTLMDPKPVNKAAVDTSTAAKTVRPVFSFEYEEKATNKSMQEVIVKSETGEGLIRKASLTRPRSNPQLQTQSTASNTLPSLDFLPQLKHQPLVKRERQSPSRPAAIDSASTTVSQCPPLIAPLAYQPPSPSSSSSEPDLKPDLKLLPRSPLRPSQFPVPTTTRANRSATDVGTLSFPQTAIAENLGAKPVAKLFVICCKCKFWHDLPSKLYEAMALPMELHKAQTGEGRVAGARLETAVKCPWCEHAMTTSCCQGWTTVVYLHERHH